MLYNLVNLLKKIALTLAIMIFSSGLTSAQSPVSLLEDEPSAETVDVVEVVDTVEVVEEPRVNEPIDDFSSFQENSGNSLVEPVRAVSYQETSTVSTEIDDSFDGFAGLEINQSEIDEINNSIGKQPQKITPQPIRKISNNTSGNVLGEDVIENIDEDLFSQMSSIEKQTSLLTLELRREKIKTEIEAIRIARAKALQEEENAKEMKLREKKEWELKQEKALLSEQEKLAKTKIAEEQLRQEKIVLAYKAQMLKETEKWIKALEVAYEKVKEVEKDRDENLISFKQKVTDLSSRASALGLQASKMKENYVREISNYQAQITALGTRIDSINSERMDGVNNPFASPGFGSTDDPNIKLSEEYIVLEITGKGENLQAKISNKTGEQAFLVRKGTALKTGHVIEEIAPTFIRADRGGVKDFIYFSAGGILDTEPSSDLKLKSIPTTEAPAGNKKENKNKTPGYLTDSFLNGMFVN